MKKRHQKVFKVKLSTPFVTRSRCAKCSGYPSQYYFIRNPPLFRSPEGMKFFSESFRKHTKRLCSSFYMDDSPIDYKSISYFNYSHLFKSYNPKIYKTRGVKTNTNYVEFLSCDCGYSNWGFSNRTDKERPEVMNRKSVRTFPGKIKIMF